MSNNMNTGEIFGVVIGVISFVGVVLAVVLVILLIIWCKWTGRFKSWLVWENWSTLTRSRHPNRDGPSNGGGMKISISQPIIDDSNLSDPGYRNTFAIATSAQYKTISSPLEENDELGNQVPNDEKRANNSPKHAHTEDPLQPVEISYTSEYAQVTFTPSWGGKEDVEGGYSDPKELGITKKVADANMPHSPHSGNELQYVVDQDYGKPIELGITKKVVDANMPHSNSGNELQYVVDQDYGEPIELGMIFKPVQTPDTPPSPDDQVSANSSDDDFWGTR